MRVRSWWARGIAWVAVCAAANPARASGEDIIVDSAGRARFGELSAGRDASVIILRDRNGVEHELALNATTAIGGPGAAALVNSWPLDENAMMISSEPELSETPGSIPIEFVSETGTPLTITGQFRARTIERVDSSHFRIGPVSTVEESLCRTPCRRYMRAGSAFDALAEGAPLAHIEPSWEGVRVVIRDNRSRNQSDTAACVAAVIIAIPVILVLGALAGMASGSGRR